MDETVLANRRRLKMLSHCGHKKKTGAETNETTKTTLVRRGVDSFTGREMFGRKGGNMAGLIIPNVAPWDASHVREYRLRLDSPDVEYCADGSTREINKYVQPAQRRNLV